MRMHAKYLFLLLFLFFTAALNAQENQKEVILNGKSFVGLSYGIGKDASVFSAAYYRNWKLSQTKKVWQNIYLGTGIRLNGFSAQDVTFRSAPPSLYHTQDANYILAPAPALYSVNTFLNIGYQITAKLQAGFDIDVFGFSFGPNGSPLFSTSQMANGPERIAMVNPTPVNLLLVNANNRGSLLSNFYVRYKITPRWGVSLATQKSYAEITTEEVLQTVPIENKRFRYVSRLVGLGVCYHFK